MARKAKVEVEASTQEKILQAARKVFTEKGYAATRTRDIAEAAEINLALLNYYFRSKEKLFEIIMTEKVQKFFGVLVPILNDADTNLDQKVQNIASRYIDMIQSNPDLPLFILSELRVSPDLLTKLIGKSKVLENSVFIRQIQEKRPDLHPLQFLVSILGMTVFPFIMRPVLQNLGIVDDKSFYSMMQQRKELIPIWTKALLKAK